MLAAFVIFTVMERKENKMEIERKFLIDWNEVTALGLPEVKSAQSWQGYLSAATPVVRIRKRDFSNGHTDYILCIKGKGKLAREEIEKELTPQEFEALEGMLPIPMIHKDYHVYRLPDGHLLECSLVDGKFAYAEVEFESVEEAKAFQMPQFLHKDVTEDPYFSMSGYWKRKQITVSFEL